MNYRKRVFANRYIATSSCDEDRSSSSGMSDDVCLDTVGFGIGAIRVLADQRDTIMGGRPLAALPLSFSPLTID